MTCISCRDLPVAGLGSRERVAPGVYLESFTISINTMPITEAILQKVAFGNTHSEQFILVARGMFRIKTQRVYFARWLPR